MIAPWALEEAADAHLGDKRLNDRFVTLLSSLGSRPNLSIPAATGGRAELKAAYGFFDNDKVTFDKVLQPHIRSSKQRLAQQPVGLLVADTSEMDLTRPHLEVTGVGTLDGTRRGFFLHLLHAFTPDGTPLGTVAAEILNRTEGVSHDTPEEKRQKRKDTPIEEKESLRWLTSLQQARQLAQELPQVSCVYIADSEADIYELIAEPRGQQPVQWLIRASQDRAVHGADSAHVRDQVLATPLLYEVQLRIRERHAKTAAEDRKRRQSRPSRQATVQVRAAQLTLRPPYRPDRKLAPVTVNVVLVHEPNPPAGAEPVEWLLLTTLPIDTPEQVRTVVEYYCARWGIEKAQADYPSRRRWGAAGRIGYHRRNGVARAGRVVPATPRHSHRRSRMSDTTRRSAPPRA